MAKNADKEAAIYCAKQCAVIGRRQSTWTYRGDEGVLYEITATWTGDDKADVSRPVRFE